MRPSWLIVLATIGCGGQPAVDTSDIPEVLIYTRTTGYRHADAIARGSQVLPARLAMLGITAEVTEDPTQFEELTGRRTVVFLYTTGNDILTPTGKAAFEAHHRAGGGFVGLHSATDTEYEWPFYQDLIVAPFASHPEIQPAAIDVLDRAHPAMASVPAGRWETADEWYNFARDPGAVAGVRVLATLDETTYSGGTMGTHPIIWAHERLGGRTIYSALGHLGARWDDPAFADHVVGAVAWSYGRN